MLFYTHITQKRERAHTIPDTDFNFLGGYTHGD